MRTVIERDSEGDVNLVVDGDSAPEAVAREYIKVRDLLFPEPVAVRPEPKIKEKELTR